MGVSMELGARRTKIVSLLAVAFSLGFAQAASAADMPVKAPIIKAPVETPFNWTGCYVGGDVGIVWARDRDNEVTIGTGVASPFSPADSAKPNGVKLGGYLGCNWQFASRFVAGIEGDGEWTSARGTANFVTPAPSDFYETKIRAEGSIRGRIGYAFDRALFYVTGGVAFANINEHDQVGTTAAFVDHSTTRSGWTVGGGLDYAFNAHWIGRAEYRYADFGTFSYNPILFPAFTENHKTTENVVRVGIAYKF
jgi:outer membrane immunogenic protein